MEVIKDILINLAANAVWAIGGILLIYFIQLKKLYSCRYKGHALKKISGCDLLLKKSFLFATTQQPQKKIFKSYH